MPLICTLHILSLRRSTTLIIGPHRDHSIVSRSTGDLTWRLWFKSTEITKNYFLPQVVPNTRKNNRFPFLDILGYSLNTHKNPKFGKVRQVPTREFPTKFPDWTCLTLPNLGFLWVFFKYPKISKNGNLLFFLCKFPLLGITLIGFMGYF